MLKTILIPVLALLSLASAKPSLVKRDLTPVTAAASATVGASAHGYTYAGCYNETIGFSNTTGARALANGHMESNATATTETCLKFCSDIGGMNFAGLEYGQECWCSQYLTSLSTKLNESSCNLACVGNDTQICGGRLTLTLFNLTSKASTSAGILGAEANWMYALGAGLLGSAAVLTGL